MLYVRHCASWASTSLNKAGTVPALRSPVEKMDNTQANQCDYKMPSTGKEELKVL